MEAKMVKNGGMIVVDDDGDINNGLDKSIGEYDGELRMKVVTKDSLTLAKAKKAPRTTSMTVGVCRRLEFDFSDPNINYEYQAADETEGDGKVSYTSQGWVYVYAWLEMFYFKLAYCFVRSRMRDTHNA